MMKIAMIAGTLLLVLLAGAACSLMNAASKKNCARSRMASAPRRS